MSIFAIIIAIFAAALMVALFLARRSIKELIAFKKMNCVEQAQAIAKVQYDNRYWAGRHSDISYELSFAIAFLSLSCLCIWCGLYYTCAYTLFFGTTVLAEGIRNQIRLFIMKHEDPTVVENTEVFEFKTA